MDCIVTKLRRDHVYGVRDAIMNFDQIIWVCGVGAVQGDHKGLPETY